MPAISNTLRKFLADGQLTPDEMVSLKNAVKAGQVKPAELKLLTDRFGDLFRAGVGRPMVDLAGTVGVRLTIQAPIRSLGDSAAAGVILRGEHTLSATTTRSGDPALVQFQHALEAIGSRGGHPEYALTHGGADGVFGNETATAIRAFQSDHGLDPTGDIDQTTAMAMEQELYALPPPDVGGVTLAASHPSGDAIAQAALDLVNTRAVEYGVAAPWKSPNPAIPGNAHPGRTPLGADNRWKCNLFGCDALYLGGAKPPTYPGGAYPIAIDIPRYGSGPHAPLVKLGEVWPGQLTPEEASARIEALLRIARPGDLIIVKHPGTATSDGGHTRVVTANSYASTGTIDCAQAGSSAAHVVAQQLSDFTGEDAVYLLRANQLGTHRPTNVS
jgi:peptidoglycan hydrolase-like protein with peptidoglycan-binding domain